MLNKNEELLSEVYKNTIMGRDSIINLLDKVSDNRLRSEMTDELSVYRRYAKEASEKLGERGLKPKELPMTAKMGAKMGMVMNTMLDTTTSHLAEMMINGATMGIIDLEKKLNDGGDGEAERLARDVLRFEKETAERHSSDPSAQMTAAKAYLRGGTDYLLFAPELRNNEKERRRGYTRDYDDDHLVVAGRR